MVSMIRVGQAVPQVPVWMYVAMPGSSQPSMTATVVPVPSMPLSHRLPML